MTTARKTFVNEIISTYGNATRNYTSMTAWEAATDVDLVTAAQSEILECYDDAASFNDYCPLLGATTSTSYARCVRPASGQGHDGTSNNGFNIANTTNAVVFSLYENYSYVCDMVAKSTITATINRSVFQNTSNGGAFVGCIAYDSVLTADTAAMAGFWSSPDGGVSAVNGFIDCLAKNISTTGTGIGCGFSGDDDGVTNYYNCTAVNNKTYGFQQTSGTVNAKNCCASGNTTADWNGTITKTTCTAEGATPTYVNAAGDDFHLAASDTVCRGNGTDLSADATYPFDDDIDKQTRSGTWDIGFDEYGVVSKTVTDSGSGADNISQVSVSFGVSDAGSGADNAGDLSSQLSVPDAGSGADILSQVLAILSVTDAGIGVDLQPGIAAGLTIGDTGTGTDAHPGIAVSFTLTDTGAGTDQVQSVSVTLQIPDAGSGADILSQVLANLSLTDAGIGVDLQPGIAAGLTVSDTGTGTDAQPGIAVSFTLTDTGAGTDLVNVIAEIIKTITDSGAGSDLVSSVAVSFSMPDAGMGTDQVQSVSVTLQIPDAGSGADLISVIKAALVIISDSGVGTDQVGSINVSVSVGDYGQGLDVVKNITSFLSVSDIGSGGDVVVRFDSASKIVRISISLAKRKIRFGLSKRSTNFQLN
jgi:uncharacterized protein YqgV (UPF0045/DUF77 family)